MPVLRSSNRLCLDDSRRRGKWGAALPTNSPGIPCIFDSQGRAGICGDWLLGSSLEAAAISGIAMADHVSSNTSLPCYIAVMIVNLICFCVGEGGEVEISFLSTQRSLLDSCKFEDDGMLQV
ncbi:hypothetical protein AKJ16_DCAP02834 [Drosera capensis]